MNRTLAFFAPLTLLSGCIIYDGTCGRGDGKCGWGDEGGINGDTSGLSGDTDTATDDTASDTDTAADTAIPDPDPSFALTPNEATAGDTFIASLTATDFDLDAVTGVNAYGSASLLATANRSDELLLTFKVDNHAAEGETVDLLLEVGADAEYLPAILTLHAAADGGGSSGDDTGGCP